MRLSVLIFLLGCLRSAAAQRISCPPVGDPPLAVTVSRKNNIIKKSRSNSVCVLVHFRPSDPTSTATTITNESKSSDFILTPVLRSYSQKNWEPVAGPYQNRAKIQTCKKRICRVKIPNLEPYSTTGQFYLISLRNEKTFDEKLSRLFSQSTFGGTSGMIDGWSYSKDDEGIAKWVEEQMEMDATTLRETYRKNVDYSPKNTEVGTNTVVPRHPCAKFSRWRDYAFSADDFGATIDVVNKSGGGYLVSVNGVPTTIVTRWESSRGEFTGIGSYSNGYRNGGAIGGTVFIMTDTISYKTIKGGNPAVVLDDATVASDSEIVVIDLPSRDEFETITGVQTPGLQTTPATGTLRLKIDIFTRGGCSDLTALAAYKKVVGKFPDGTFVWYNGFAELAENTPDSPIADGGLEKIALGVEKCSNVPKNFLNIETCSVSTANACDYKNNHKATPNTVVCGSPNEIANRLDLPVKDTQKFQFGGSNSDASFYAGADMHKMALWYENAIKASDQFRQRAAWALSQLLVVTQNQIDNGSIWTEIYLPYEDIFVRNAFGNYRDILREVSYSPMMAEMLSYLDSTSSMYARLREGRTSRPDENYAREIMQLFTVGLYKLKMDGNRLMSKEGEPIPSYDNLDIQTFARAWTGFGRQGSRSNLEGFKWNPNKVDPMKINGHKRDPFPKLDLQGGFIGDGYPLCKNMPPDSFLRKGATYRAVGNHNQPELTYETNFWKSNGDTTRTELDPSSKLYEVLCNAKGGSTCDYPVLVRLEDDLTCTGVECDVNTLSLIKMGDSASPIYYEYMPFPCIEMAFIINGKKVVDAYSRAMCADPGVNDLVMDSCCPASFAAGKALSKCKYSGERISYATNVKRCEASGGQVCDFDSGSWTSEGRKCGLGIQRWSASFRWTSASCSTRVKVDNSGLIKIMHSPNLKASQTVWDPVSDSIDNKNSFKIKWDNDVYPTLSAGNCGTCEALEDGCLCDISGIKEGRALRRFPTVYKVTSELKIGSPPPEWLDLDYTMALKKNDVEIWVLTSNYNPDKVRLRKTTIFGVTYKGKKTYYQNKSIKVKIANGDITYSFRNPPSLMSLIDQKTSDAYYETEAVLDHYIEHDSTAPFIATRMIKRLVTSNPSPAYISRVAAAFKSGTYTQGTITFGDGVNGNLAATFAAIILDTEARNVNLDVDPAFGSLKEPIVKMLSFMRAMEFQQPDNAPTIRLADMITKIGQEPFANPNVFSFFLPEYASPGATRDASLTSPEAQILNSPKIVGFLNGMMSMIDTGLGNCGGGFGLKAVNDCNQYKNSYTPEANSRGYFTYTPKATDDRAIVDELALLLTAGRLSNNSREVLTNAYSAETDKDKALKSIMKLILMTPEFHSTGLFFEHSEARPEPALPTPSTKPYKAIVYVNLNGGLDSYNMLVPHSDCLDGKDMFKEYSDVRQSIAVSIGSLDRITASGQICNTFGVNKQMSHLTSLYNKGHLSFFANLGILQQPVTDKGQYRQQNSKTALFAHNTQQEEINSVDIYDDTAGLGICGRITDILHLNGFSPGTVSVSGAAPALVSNKAPLQVVNPNGYEKFNPLTWAPVSRDDIKSVNKAAGIKSSMLSEIWSDGLFQSIGENDVLFQEMSSATLSSPTAWKADDFGRQMSSIAKLVKTRDARGTDRDVFYSEIAGFDTHGKQEAELNIKMKEVNDGLKAFVEEMEDQNLWDDVAIVVVSEFGRTLLANTGNGSDHGWGGNYFVASGSMKGGKILGEYPHDLTPSGSQIISDVGILIPSTPWESVWNGVAEWFGIDSENDLKTILPNRQAFANMLFSKNDLFN